jgi:inosose dehydratase
MPAAKAKLKRNRVSFGITPTSWWNDDFPDMDIGIPFGQCVSEMALAGFEGCSIGHKYPTDIAVLKRELGMRGLRVSEPWASTYFTIKDMYKQTLSGFKEQMKFIKSVGGTDMVVAELGNAVHQQPVSLVANRPIIDDRQWDAMTKGLNLLGKMAKDAGLRLCYHHHMGTCVQTRADVDRLAASTDPKLVNLLLDTGHLTFAGDDPVDFVRTYAKRIKHVHLKNIRLSIMRKALREKLTFREAILAGVFTVPGDPAGSVDFPSILQLLADNNYAGWIMVEAEQDPAKAHPLASAKMARDYLRKVTGL